MNLTVGEMKKLLEGQPDEAVLAIQDQNNPEFAMLLEGASASLVGDTLFIEHNGEGGYLEMLFDEEE